MTKEEYYNSIPIGRENAISRASLAKMWNMSQDSVRHMIAILRADDNGDDFIIYSSSNPNHPGYYRTDDPVERRNFMRETKFRAINTFKPLKKAQRIENGDSGQYSLSCNLKQYRVSKGINNKDFCDSLSAAGVPMNPPLLSRIENGYVLPTPAAANLMAELIGCDVADLFGFGYAALLA